LTVVVLLFSLSAQSCLTDIGEDTIVTGTVVYLSFEGGSYGIKGDDGRNYDPVNLPQDFRVDGLRVRIEVKELKGSASFHMWGIPVEIVHIQKL
jgi:hypothetical protein